jgi:hypothetical protein
VPPADPPWPAHPATSSTADAASNAYIDLPII